MGHFERHLRARRGGSSTRLVPGASPAPGSVEELAEELATWPTWYDVSPYDGGAVPFFKRAQIAAADLALARLGPRPASTG